jgi:uncharacterized membrane protein (Fun14 family)
MICQGSITSQEIDNQEGVVRTGLIDEIINFITNGGIGGLLPLTVIIAPFIIGLIMGFFVNKLLKIAVIIIIILTMAIYFGLYSLDISTLQQLATQYIPLAISIGILLLGMLPLSIGFIIGAIAGFILG